MIKIQDRAPELRAEAEKVGLTVREDASFMFRSPFIYLYAYGDRDRFIILSDAAEMGEDGFYVSRYRVNESAPSLQGSVKQTGILWRPSRRWDSVRPHGRIPVRTFSTFVRSWDSRLRRGPDDTGYQGSG